MAQDRWNDDSERRYRERLAQAREERGMDERRGPYGSTGAMPGHNERYDPYDYDLTAGSGGRLGEGSPGNDPYGPGGWSIAGADRPRGDDAGRGFFGSQGRERTDDPNGLPTSGYRDHRPHHRNFLEKAGDEVASWAGDRDAARRREMDHRQDHRGRGPSGYTRSDERINDDVHDRLTEDWQLDATHITVSVAGGEVTLDGKVHSRWDKRRAEDIADNVGGVTHVQNNLRVDATLDHHDASTR